VREEKPFALMVADLAAVERHTLVSERVAALLDSVESPVVLLPERNPSSIASEVAPGRNQLGFMLPYSPLHHLLLERAEGFPDAVVMTSGNRSDEPIVFENEDARARLGDIADAFLLHDRPIHVRTDDSVLAEHRGGPYFFRRSRGYAPFPISLPFTAPPLLAVGGELKNTFCVVRDRHAFLGHHIGDLEYAENVDAFMNGAAHFERLFRVQPETIVHDLHPDYRSTRYALERAETDGLTIVAVQHHHAHVAACMAEHGLGEDRRVLGLSFDGTGYGSDGAIWGGEFLIAGYRDFERPLHLAYCPLPGGDAAIRAPCRTALSWLRQAGVEWSPDLAPVQAVGEEERSILRRQLELSINAPRTSSLGRLFDTVASLCGIRQRTSYEGQAACELEAAAAAAPGEEGAYSFELGADQLEAAPVIREVVDDARRGVPPAIVSARFHRGLAEASVLAGQRLREASGLEEVVLSGGVWQNLILLRDTTARLERAGFQVLVHRQVPANDGGLALGQAAVAAARAAAGSRVLEARRAADRSTSYHGEDRR
jgi:hydrogenase maturation protein HypF